MDKNGLILLRVSPDSPYPVSLRVDGVTTALYRGLGLDQGIRRRPIGEQGWAARLRAFARPLTWALPLGWAVTALAVSWRWPTATRSTEGVSPGTWLIFMLAGLVLGLVGVLGLGALLAATRARFWAILAVLAVVAGTVALAPVLGLVALTGDAPAEVKASLFSGHVARELGTAGVTLLAVGWLLAALAILTADVFSRLDGLLIVAGAALALLGVAVGSPHLVVFAALLPLAGGLGVAWHAGRIAPDGRLN